MSRSHSLYALVPLLSLLAISPQEMDSHLRSRGLASVEEVIAPRVQNPYPRVSKILKSISKSSLDINNDQSVEEFSQNLLSLKERVSEEKNAFKANFTELDDVKSEQDRLAGSVRAVAQLEADLLLNISIQESATITINEIKSDLEFMLLGLYKNEKKLTPKPVQEVVAEVKSEEVKEEVKEEIKEEICTENHQEQASPANNQINQLIQNQTLMIQMMMQMQQQMFSTYTNNVPAFNYQQAYQYQPTFMPGWNYQQQQSPFQMPQVSDLAHSIFSQPAQPQMPSQYPMGNNLGSWGLTPAPMDMQMDPRFAAPSFTAGEFGIEAFGFNLQQTPGAGVVSSPVPSSNYPTFGI